MHVKIHSSSSSIRPLTLAVYEIRANGVPATGHLIPTPSEKTWVVNYTRLMSSWGKRRGVWVAAFFFFLGFDLFAVRRAPGVGQARIGQDGNGMIPMGCAGLDDHELYSTQQNKCHTFMFMPHARQAHRVCGEVKVTRQLRFSPAL